MATIVQMAGRYALGEAIASGGAASVYLAVPAGAPGGTMQAIKRMHPHLASDPAFATMFLDEARLVSHIRHPSVVPTLEVIEDDGDVLLVMEYVHGESLADLLKEARTRKQRLGWGIVTAIMTAVLDGLEAAHEATNEHGEALAIVHRDVSPQNILVGVDGRARLIDFGVAKARGRINTTRDGQIKGKLAYMAPEHLRGEPVTRLVDIYAASVVLWEALTGRRMFTGNNEGELVMRVLEGIAEAPSRWSVDPSMTPTSEAFRQIEKLDAVTLRGLAHAPAARFATAREMSEALAKCVPPAQPAEVAAWVADLAREQLSQRAATVAELVREARALERVASPDSLPTIPRASRIPEEETPVVPQAAVRPEDPLGASPMRGMTLRLSTAPPVAAPRTDVAHAVPMSPPMAVAMSTPMSVAPPPMSKAPTLTDRREWDISVHSARRLVPTKARLSLAVRLGALALVATCVGALAFACARGRAPEPVMRTVAAREVASFPVAVPGAVTTRDPVEDAVPLTATLPVQVPSPAPSRRVATTPRKTPEGGKAPAPDCDPPYTRDSAGIILHKPQCISQ